jgi:hypothetical protein
MQSQPGLMPDARKPRGKPCERLAGEANTDTGEHARHGAVSEYLPRHITPLMRLQTGGTTPKVRSNAWTTRPESSLPGLLVWFGLDATRKGYSASASDTVLRLPRIVDPKLF